MPKKSKRLPDLNANMDWRMPPVDAGEIGFALGVFQAALLLRMPMESPAKKGIPMPDKERGEEFLHALPNGVREMFTARDNRIAPKDVPFHRGVFAVLDHYKDHVQREAIATRVVAFFFLVNDCYGTGRWDKWQKESDEPGAKLLHPAVIEAVATIPLTRYGGFLVDDFFVAVENIAEQNYAEES